jgi:hypothetical protein
VALSTAVGADSTLVPLRRDVTDIVIPIAGVDAGVPGHIGVDLLIGDEGLAPCLDPQEPYLSACSIAGSYYKVVHLTSTGYVPAPNAIVINNVDNGVPTGWADKTTAAHLEIYPYGNAGHTEYDPWTQSIGGAHLWVRDFPEPGDGTATAPAVGVVPAPRLGDGQAFRVDGDTVANTPLTNDRLRIDLFQLTGPNGAALPAAGPYPVGSFATSTSRGARWTGGAVWPGTYSMYVFDYATDRTVNAFVDLAPGHVPTIDLDAPCFGLDPCQYLSGGLPAATGTFHPVPAARILDTRRNLGITGAVRPGDGRSSSASLRLRQSEALGHELTVTGVGGVPAHGVSGVLLQLTGADPDTDGAYLSVYPKPPRVDLWNDRTGFPAAEPAFSNVNVPQGEAVANLVYVPVGAGGTIRLNSRPGTTNAIADVVGWFDDGDGSGASIQAVTPSRILDTRHGTGGPSQPFGAGETRSLAVRGHGGVPDNATAVVVNLTADRATADSFVTAWPDGVPRPDASALNPRPGPARSGLATVPLGDDGSVSLYNALGQVDLIADVVGYVTAGAGVSTAVNPVRILDTRITTRPLAPGESRLVHINGVPAGAHAVWLNITGTNATEPGYLTVWPSGSARPDASNLNVAPDRPVANLVLVPLRADGAVQVFNAAGTLDLLVDLAGYLS